MHAAAHTCAMGQAGRVWRVSKGKKWAQQVCGKGWAVRDLPGLHAAEGGRCRSVAFHEWRRASGWVICGPMCVLMPAAAACGLTTHRLTSPRMPGSLEAALKVGSSARKPRFAPDTPPPPGFTTQGVRPLNTCHISTPARVCLGGARVDALRKEGLAAEQHARP